MADRGTFEDWQERIVVLKACAAILDQHGFNGDKGLCTDFGANEGNPIQTIYFYNASCMGDSGEYMRTFCDGSWETVFAPSSAEREIFGELPDHPYFEVSVDAQGLIFGQWITSARLNILQVDQDASEEDSD